MSGEGAEKQLCRLRLGSLHSQLPRPGVRRELVLLDECSEILERIVSGRIVFNSPFLRFLFLEWDFRESSGRVCALVLLAAIRQWLGREYKGELLVKDTESVLALA